MPVTGNHENTKYKETVLYFTWPPWITCRKNYGLEELPPEEWTMCQQPVLLRKVHIRTLMNKNARKCSPWNHRTVNCYTIVETRISRLIIITQVTLYWGVALSMVIERLVWWWPRIFSPRYFDTQGIKTYSTDRMYRYRVHAENWELNSMVFPGFPRTIMTTLSD